MRNTALFYIFFPVWERIVIEYSGMEILEKEPICMDKLYIVIPAYNEEAMLLKTAKTLKEILSREEIAMVCCGPKAFRRRRVPSCGGK